MTGVDDLAGFLLARIAEDETEALRAIEILKDPALLGRLIPGWASWPRRLAECEAKRRIVEMHSAVDTDGCTVCLECGPTEDVPFRVKNYGLGFPCPTLRSLALPYADHPDYRPEWRP